MIGLAGVGGDVATAKAVACYAFGLPGAIGTGLVLLAGRRQFSAPVRPLAPWVAAGFALTGVLIAISVDPAPLWPANACNQAWFLAATGLPVQLFLGVIAMSLAALIWAAWGHGLMQAFNSPRYNAYLKQQFAGVVATMAAILILGGVLTNLLDGIYRNDVEDEAAGDVELLLSFIGGEISKVNESVKLLAGAPEIAALLVDGRTADLTTARAALDRHVQAAGASRGLIIDRRGKVVDASERREFVLVGAPDQHGATWFVASLGGGAGRELRLDPLSRERSFVTSYPVRDAAGSIVGVVALEKPLDALHAHLQHFDQAFFLIDSTGLVVMTNRPDEYLHTLWPQPIAAQADRAGRPQAPALLAHEVVSSEWTKVEGRRAYVLRHDVAGTPWSLALALPFSAIGASRLLGIIVTLQFAIAALFYFFGRERGMRDRVQRLHSIALQSRATALARQAVTDALTGLYNRLKFDERLEEEFGRARRTGRPFSLILYDVDRFKAINDRYGHPVGDQVLVQMSAVAAAGLRQTDLIARWGGEEFAILLADTDAAAAYDTADKLRQSIARTRFDQVGTVTASFGVTQCHAGDDAESLMSRVDCALYRAKLNGRNRVELDTPMVESAALSPVA